MNNAQVHLMINTLPPIVSCLALMAMAVGLWWRSEHLKRFALLLIVAVPLLIIPVYITGSDAVVVVGNLPNVPLDLIGEHEESVTATWIASGVAGVIGAAGLLMYRRERRLPFAFIGCVLVASFVADLLLLRTAHLGGCIRHPEARGSFRMPG